MRPCGKSRFALFFGNRGFSPPELIMQAREEISSVLKKLGHETLMMGAEETMYGAVSNKEDAAKYAKFLKENVRCQLWAKFGEVCQERLRRSSESWL